MSGFEKYLDENGVSLAIGMILGVGLVIWLVIMIAIGDRRPPDKKE